MAAHLEWNYWFDMTGSIFECMDCVCDDGKCMRMLEPGHILTSLHQDLQNKGVFDFASHFRGLLGRRKQMNRKQKQQNSQVSKPKRCAHLAGPLLAGPLLAGFSP